jgi:hypothetical protein
MLQFLGVFIVILLPIAECGANPLDDCILQNMAGVTSDAAAIFVRVNFIKHTARSTLSGQRAPT